jgi:pyridoxal phosphate enzyme (YggS family)
MNIANAFLQYQNEVSSYGATLVAVSKTKPNPDLMAAYEAGCRVFGENKVQEMAAKYEELPKDIQWHLIGHLQTNKVKYIASFVHLIHAVDSFKLLEEINKQGAKAGMVINCLLQVYIAQEETKFGLDKAELLELLNSDVVKSFENIKLCGLMGMATNTDNEEQIAAEFEGLKQLFEEVKLNYSLPNTDWKELSMGMSGDYKIALEHGSTMVRIGSSIFGHRSYAV